MEEQRPIFELEERLGANWARIRDAHGKAALQLAELATALDELSMSDDCAVVAYGSLARREVTSGSDVDWTLLLDCRADPKHHMMARRVGELLARTGHKEPGREGVFGAIAISHDLVHQIGGQDDTNANTTRRVLLLLESVRLVGGGNPDAHGRVVRAVLTRYVDENTTVGSQRGRLEVPRFLLNDIARYWRTMCVDFAYKVRARGGKGSALRNLKLRMSRKLLFASGLFNCFACELGTSGFADSTRCRAHTHSSHQCVHCLQRSMAQPPLDVLAEAVLQLGGSRGEAAARQAIDAYDEFLGILDDEEKRKHLNGLEGDIDNDAIFDDGRRLSHEFRDGIQSLFFNSHDKLTELTQNFGVF